MTCLFFGPYPWDDSPSCSVCGSVARNDDDLIPVGDDDVCFECIDDYPCPTHTCATCAHPVTDDGWFDKIDPEIEAEHEPSCAALERLRAGEIDRVSVTTDYKGAGDE